MSENPERPQRYCTNCGAALRAGTSFCVSCGVALSATGSPDITNDTPTLESTPEEGQPNEAEPRPVGGSTFTGPGTSATGPTGSLADSIQESFGGWRGRFSGASSTSDRATTGSIPDRAINWFRDLPSIPKLIIVGLIVVLLLTLLSPLAFFAGVLGVVVSIIILSIRVVNRRAWYPWFIGSLVAVLVTFATGGISDALYGTGFLGGNGLGLVGSSETASESNPTDTSSPYPSSSASPSSSSASGASPSASPGPNPSPSSSPSAAALEPGDEITIAAQPWGGTEDINYEGREVVGMVFEYQGQRIMVLADLLSSPGSQLRALSVSTVTGSEAPTVTVHGEYQGVVSLADGRSYEAIMADSIEYE